MRTGEALIKERYWDRNNFNTTSSYLILTYEIDSFGTSYKLNGTIMF